MTRPTLSRRTLIAAGAALAALAVSPAPARTPGTAAWVIEPDAARALLAAGAVLLDARGADLRDARPLPGAVPVAWQDFTNPDLPIRGRLLADDAALTARLQALGLRADVPVVVVADAARGWGEDGRIVWTLRTLGHPQAHLVNGGIAALLAAGTLAVTPPARPGDFVVARTDAHDVTREELARLIGRVGVVILDTRAPQEYAGATPHGESRGGHVPGARHLFFRDLMGPDGRILDRATLRARLAALGVDEATEVVSYCTGGIRSGLVTAVLLDAGIRARNYSGSMWEWSAADPAAYPLVTE